MTKLEQIKALDPEVIRNFLAHRESSDLAPSLADYIIKMNAAASIIHLKGTALKQVTDALMRNFQDLTYSKARTIFYDAMNFFYIDDNLSAATWDNYYADQMENLGRLAIQADQFSVAMKCFAKAHEYRTMDRNVINPEDWKPPVFVISTDVKPEDLGYKSKKVYEIARRKEDKEIANIINGLPVPEAERNRLMREAQVVDTDYEEVEDGE